MSQKIFIGGHRGAGQTDAPHVRDSDWARAKPAENTLESIALAFAGGADFVEIDVMLSADDIVVVTHSNDLAQHVFDGQNHGMVRDLNWADLEKLGAGAGKTGNIPRLSDILAFMITLPMRSDWPMLNIEIKGVKGTATPYSQGGDVVRGVVETVFESGFPLENIVFSSFSASDLQQIRALAPTARLGMLFEIYSKDERPIYPEMGMESGAYLHFTAENIMAVDDLVGLEFVHPEYHDMRDARALTALDKVAELGLAMNLWGIHEQPAAIEAASGIIGHMLDEIAVKRGIPLGIITDDSGGMRQAAKN